MITDLVFWFILYPFLAHNEYEMNFVSNPFTDFEYYISIYSRSPSDNKNQPEGVRFKGDVFNQRKKVEKYV
jgi:hypothetical protein